MANDASIASNPNPAPQAATREVRPVRASASASNPPAASSHARVVSR
jgi:hypothetical protein